MKFLNKGISLQQLKHTLPLFLALIVAGLAGNYFKFPIKATAAGGAIPVTAITASALSLIHI